MNEHRIYRRLLHRTRHRSRSVAVSVVLVLVALVAIYLGIESVLAALEAGPLLVAPVDALAFHSVYLGFVALLGLALVIIAIVPAHRDRHQLADERMAVVVDDIVLAGAIKSASLREARVPANRMTVSLGRRLAVVRVIPTSGAPLSASTIEDASARVLESLEPLPAVHSRARVAERGVVGS